jgi:hypothetical protein
LNVNVQRICFLGTRTRNFDATSAFFRTPPSNTGRGLSRAPQTLRSAWYGASGVRPAAVPFSRLWTRSSPGLSVATPSLSLRRELDRLRPGGTPAHFVNLSSVAAPSPGPVFRNDPERK